MTDAIKGVAVGTLIGGVAGLGVCIWIIPETSLFPGDTILAGAVICGVLGQIYGDSFFTWLGENWHQLFLVVNSTRQG